jgi:hypothetical protein
MTRFHRAIAPLYPISDMVTTNWDDFFERECDFDAFVSDADMPLWDASKRRVMKIHGSVRNLGSLVATSSDYKKSFQRLNNGPMGAQLKSFLTRRTFVYTGYSLSDENFCKLACTIAQMAKPHVRHSYFISPTIDESRLANFPIPLIPIKTSGAYFFEQIRTHLEVELGIVKDSAFDACDEALSDICNLHVDTADMWQKKPYPLLTFALSYQDGLIHGLRRIKDKKSSGEYHSSHRVMHLAQAYEQKAKGYEKKHNYWDAAYSYGYANAMWLLIFRNDGEDDSTPPPYGRIGRKIISSLSFATRYPKSKLPKQLLAQDERIFNKCASGQMIPDHTPYC